MPGRIVRGSRTTWLSVLNFAVFQWTFVRLARIGSIQGPEERFVQTGWALIGPIVPMTGWWTAFVGPYRSIVKWDYRDLDE